ncbi:branched-chain amino acid ABC transporter permease [Neorhizobium sp. NCHU2750]|uniref:branched-chain amino acid ABC transporter permease n=1 Tax=Neorhizobium sp. NCHU2750 TaxID=1825976 RepID=UPI000E7249E4|nr:branched-chain amino acid ABC transporter permease [Neorhizobium sp. NCHU2750]
MSDFIIHVAIMSGFYALLALSLNLQAGFGGLMNFGQIALFACGAYASALAFRFDLGVVSGFVLAMVAAGILGWAFASVGRNLQADYWGIVTLALAEVIRIVATNEDWLTGGAQGIGGIPPLYPGLDNQLRQIAILVTVALLVIAAGLLCRHLMGGRYGLAIKMMREEPQLAASLGYDTIAIKRQLTVIAALLAAVSGFLFARYVSFVGPEQIDSSETFLIWAMIVVGGLGNNAGAIVGAFLLQFTFAFIPFVKDWIGLPTEYVAAGRLFLTGGGLIAFIVWRQSGIVPERVGGGRYV